MRNVSLSSNSSLISNYSTVSSGSSLSASSTVALLQGLMDGFGWRDQRLEIYQAEANQQLDKQKLRMAIDRYVEETSLANRDRLIQALNEVQVSVQTEYDYALKQWDYYQEQVEIEAAQKRVVLTASYLSQWSQWALDGVKSFFGSTTMQLAEKYAAMAEAHQITLAQISRCFEDLTIPMKDDQDSFALSSLCEAPLGVLELSNLMQPLGFVINGVMAKDQSGSCVSRAGDLNNDGIDDLVIGAPRAAPHGKASAGVSYVILGSKNLDVSNVLELSSLNSATGVVINGATAGDESGYSVNGVGDLNDDGIDDLVIGAYTASPNGKNGAGASYVVFGSSRIGSNGILELSNLNGVNGFVINGVTKSDNSGYSVSGAGDLNQDGIDDLVIGAYSASPNGKYTAGASYVIFGSKNLGSSGVMELSGLNGVTGFVINGVAINDKSGYAVSRAGDLNDDGIDDLVIGAYTASPNGKNGAGASYVIFGSKNLGISSVLELSSLNGSTGLIINGVAVGGFSGCSVSGVGDLNHDHMDDLAIGASGVSSNGIGTSYVVFGSKEISRNGVLELSSLNGTNGFVIKGVGGFVNGVGDLNQDGMDDLVIGSPGASPNGKSAAGASYVIFGSSGIGSDGVLELSNLTGINGFVINGVTKNDHSGSSVSGVGDLNHDGITDLVIGASSVAIGSNLYVGASYVVFGSPDFHPFITNQLTLLQGEGIVLNADELSLRPLNNNQQLIVPCDIQFGQFELPLINFPWATNSGLYRRTIAGGRRSIYP